MFICTMMGKSRNLREKRWWYLFQLPAYARAFPPVVSQLERPDEHASQTRHRELVLHLQVVGLSQPLIAFKYDVDSPDRHTCVGI